MSKDFIMELQKSGVNIYYFSNPKYCTFRYNGKTFNVEII